MIRLAVIVAMGVAAFAAPSFAQQTTQSLAGSSAVAIAGGGSSGPIEYRGGYDVNTTRQAVPLAQSLAIGPCTTGVGGGGTGGGWGFLFNFAQPDNGCDARADAEVWARLGRPDIAYARMALQPKNAEAIRMVEEQRRALASARPAQAPDVKPQPVLARSRPAWCDKARPDSEAARNYVVEVCG